MKSEKNAYEQVASVLRERILKKEILPRQQLPTEQDLGREFNVSRITIRRALDILEEEHLIHKKQGKGSFVSPNPIRRIPLLIDYARSVRVHAPNLYRNLRQWKWSPAPEWAAQKLHIRAGELILYCERVDILNEEAVAYDRAYIVSAFADKLGEEDLKRVDFNEVWPQRCGFVITSCTQTVDAVEADEAASGILSLPPGFPVLKGMEVYKTHYNRPTGLFDNFYHPAHISLVSNFNWA
ncbi:MAG: GntR family transcriptional regulator [Spirochaetaceae bacterium]